MTFTKNKESLNLKLAETSSETEKAKLMLTYCCFNKISRWKDCEEIAKTALVLAEKNNYQEGVGLACLEIGYQNWFSEKFDTAFDFLEKSAEILIHTDNYFKYSRAIAVKSSILWSKGNRKEAIAQVFNGLRHINNSAKPSDGLWLEWFLGIYYFDLKDYSNSEAQYLKALYIIDNTKLNTRDAYAYCLIGYGGVLMQTKREKQAFEYFLTAKNFTEKNGLWMQEARVLHDLGNYYEQENNLLEAKNHFLKSYDIRKVHNTKPALISSMHSLANIEKDHNVLNAIEYAEEALNLSEIIGAKQKIKVSHLLLSNIYKLKNDISLSYSHLEKANLIESQFAGEKFSSELKNIESKFIQELLERETQILASQNEELKKANKIIERQYKEISDSIQYARRIQTAILPPNKLVKNYLQESFIIYIPKDIVAGDFYWMEHIGDTILFAVADCTGHGVPGAMISLVCNNALNRAVREFNVKTPSEILDKVRELILLEFESGDEQFNDGMDISMCSLDIKTNKLNWAGANSPIWIYKHHTKLMQEIKGDKQPIGRYPIETPFTNHEMHLDTGDIIFIFSDGFADQFGGSFNKKLMRKNFRDHILQNSHLSLNQQRESLLNKFSDWKGENEQIDDVCVIGVKIT